MLFLVPRIDGSRQRALFIPGLANVRGQDMIDGGKVYDASTRSPERECRIPPFACNILPQSVIRQVSSRLFASASPPAVTAQSSRILAQKRNGMLAMAAPFLTGAALKTALERMNMHCRIKILYCRNFQCRFANEIRRSELVLLPAAWVLLYSHRALFRFALDDAASAFLCRMPRSKRRTFGDDELVLG